MVNFIFWMSPKTVNSVQPIDYLLFSELRKTIIKRSNLDET